MSEYLEIAILGVALFAMKALPFIWRIVPRSPRVTMVLDLLPAGLLTALIFPAALLGAANQNVLPGALVLAAIVASVLISLRTGKAALGIAAGLILLAIAEVISA
ncbi:MAG: AzlD domain-containing protein [Rhodospirillales bacterium]